MPKQVYKIRDFSGGINNNNDPRDILENQFVELQNVAVDRGKIVMQGNCNLVHTAAIAGANAITMGGNGRGLIAVSTDFVGLLDDTSAQFRNKMLNDVFLYQESHNMDRERKLEEVEDDWV